MTEDERAVHFKRHRTHAYVIYLGCGLYLSDDNKGVSYGLARVFRIKDKAYEYSNRYRGQVEIADIDYSLTGLYMREPLEE